MGLATAAARVQLLISQKNDLENKILLVAQSESTLSQFNSDLLQAGNDFTDPNSPVLKELNARQQRIHVLEKRLEMQKSQYQARLKAVETELESAKQMAQKQIESTFRYAA
mgnify:CR=1 FL=1